MIVENLGFTDFSNGKIFCLGIREIQYANTCCGIHHKTFCALYTCLFSARIREKVIGFLCGPVGQDNPMQDEFQYIFPLLDLHLNILLQKHNPNVLSKLIREDVQQTTSANLSALLSPLCCFSHRDLFQIYQQASRFLYKQ